MAGVRFNQVSKKYGKVEVIKPVSFEVKDKEFVVLVGPSGCGKSTLLRMIAGLEDITEGTVEIGDKVVNKLPPKDRDIAIVFQNYALYPHMTAFQNMAFGLKIRGFKKVDIKKKVMNAARILEIEELLDRKPKSMSGGQRQRIAIGRAIVRNPQVFLFDEPLSNLDAKLRGQMRLEIASLHDRLETTMIYVTHDQVEAMTLGDRIIVMNTGEIQQIDTPHNLYNEPKNQFVAGFIGSPNMNFVDGQINRINGGLKFTSSDQSLVIPLYKDFEPYENIKVNLGIRPEHIYSRTTRLEGYASYQAKIIWTEILGHDGFAFFNLNGKKMAARLESRELINPPFEKELFFDLNKIYFFDQKSGIRIKV